MAEKGRLNAHSFRHTHATQLIEQGATPNGVAGRLGHANTQITQDLYVHNTQKLQKDTAEIFAKNLHTNA
ncbi:MAG: tyrosine-type recombinase/integrase [Selenomonadaceae bacterium]|nr:tyrosine-type recombinase/integrase [Selenomonadaceae bacterium]